MKRNGFGFETGLPAFRGKTQGKNVAGGWPGEQERRQVR